MLLLLFVYFLFFIRCLRSKEKRLRKLIQRIRNRVIGGKKESIMESDIISIMESDIISIMESDTIRFCVYFGTESLIISIFLCLYSHLLLTLLLQAVGYYFASDEKYRRSFHGYGPVFKIGKDNRESLASHFN